MSLLDEGTLNQIASTIFNSYNIKVKFDYANALRDVLVYMNNGDLENAVVSLTSIRNHLGNGLITSQQIKNLEILITRMYKSSTTSFLSNFLQKPTSFEVQ